jgi:hypothetical protein
MLKLAFLVIVCITCHAPDLVSNEFCGQRSDVKEIEVHSCRTPIIDRRRSMASSAMLSEHVLFLSLRGPAVRLRTTIVSRTGLLNKARLRGGSHSNLSERYGDSTGSSNQIQTAIISDLAKSEFNSNADSPPSNDALAYLHNESIAGNKFARYLLKMCSNSSLDCSLQSQLSSDAQAHVDNMSSAVEVFANASRRGHALAALLLGQVTNYSSTACIQHYKLEPMPLLTRQCYSEGLGIAANATRAAELFQVLPGSAAARWLTRVLPCSCCYLFSMLLLLPLLHAAAATSSPCSC